MRFNLIRIVSLGLLLMPLWVAGCRDPQVQTYQIPKETQPTLAQPGGNGLPPGPQSPDAHPPGVHWHPPSHWEGGSSSGMRLASYSVTGKNGQNAEVTVVSLGGQAGGLLANVNRWRGQLQLPAITANELNQFLTSEPLNNLTVQFVSLQNPTSAMIVGIVPYGPIQYFFKIFGDRATVTAETDTFKQFVKDVHFD